MDLLKTALVVRQRLNHPLLVVTKLPVKRPVKDKRLSPAQKSSLIKEDCEAIVSDLAALGSGDVVEVLTQSSVLVRTIWYKGGLSHTNIAGPQGTAEPDFKIWCSLPLVATPLAWSEMLDAYGIQHFKLTASGVPYFGRALACKMEGTLVLMHEAVRSLEWTYTMFVS